MSTTVQAERERVVLYNPHAVFNTMPLALVAVGSALDRDRFEVRVIDARLDPHPHETLLREARGAICVGMSVLTGAPISDALAASRLLAKQHPQVPVVWGGWHASLFPTETLAEQSIAVTVRGQGEMTFSELVERFADGEPLDGLPGIAFRKDGIPVETPARALALSNDLPAHDYGLLEVDHYFRKKGQRQFDYISSTGCHFRCAFCADPFVYGRGWVGLSSERIANELEQLWKQYQFEELAFQDETFFTYPQRVLGLAAEIQRRKLSFRWSATLRADQAVRLGEAGLAECARAGLDHVIIGVESGSQEMLDWMKKDITLEQIEIAAGMCKRHDIGVTFPFIVGFPGETPTQVDASVAWAKRLRGMSPRFETPVFFFKPYPGSPITQRAVADGYVLPQTLEEWAHFDFIGSSNPWVSAETERRIRRFRFYNKLAGGPRSVLRSPFQQLARWRCQRDIYALPIEMHVIERLKPALS
jgi:radical SAM superfamily enzyme YgiQ (UPF0313 family)